MLIFEFDQHFKYGLNSVKYKHYLDTNWSYMYIDIETLLFIIKHFGVISNVNMPGKKMNLDNCTTGTIINMKYCNADLTVKFNSKFNYYAGLDALMKS